LSSKQPVACTVTKDVTEGDKPVLRDKEEDWKTWIFYWQQMNVKIKL